MYLNVKRGEGYLLAVYVNWNDNNLLARLKKKDLTLVF